MTVKNIAKQLKESASIIALLDRLGYQPVPKRGRESMYVSMLRDNDSNPSLSVNDRRGVWYDHGTGKGGNIIDLGMAYWENLSFSAVVRKIYRTLNDGLSAEPIVRPKPKPKIPNYVLYQTRPLGNHPAVKTYLQSRGIYEVAKSHLKEVYYYLEDEDGNRKKFFSAGWPNEQNGWEVRNLLFKGCMGPKAISFISGNPKMVAVFEGFLDFLSWKKEHPDDARSIIVLNAVTMLQQAISKSKSFSDIDLYFDHDKAGMQSTNEFIRNLPYARDRSGIYDGYKDYNDKIIDELSVNPAIQVEDTRYTNGVKR